MRFLICVDEITEAGRMSYLELSSAMMVSWGASRAGIGVLGSLFRGRFGKWASLETFVSGFLLPEAWLDVAVGIFVSENVKKTRWL